MTDAVAEAVARIRAWGEARDWRGWDPYDALNSPLAPPTVLGRRVFTQAVKLSPVNLRPALLIRPEWNEKAIALVASGYARLADAGDVSARTRAEHWLDWLVDRGPGWGYHFPVQTRIFRYERGAPNVIATCFVAHAFHDGSRDDDARAACAFLVERLHTGAYFRYLEREDELIHNANALACAALARTDDAALREVAAESLGPTLRAQRPDGSWPYSEEHDWVDNFHTAYVLESLAHCRGMPGVDEALERGLAFWERELFDSDGRPRYFAGRRGPLDAHSYASAIDAWLAAGDLERASHLADLLIHDLLDRDGFVRARRGRRGVAFVRWTTAPAFKALAGVLLRRQRASLD